MNAPTATPATIYDDSDEHLAGGLAVRDATLVEPDAATDLHAVLKRHFGYDTFRPLQDEIIADTLANRDVLVLMPTGGGKSLCYQLPALVRPGLTVVVSPLIALMKDQVDSLRRHGVPAALLNSTLDQQELRDVVRGLRGGRFRLLYVAPERLMKPGFLAEMVPWKPALFAIDEAHCISEWGHDFRPEYRQMADLRLRFPEVPMMALTATATERVRADIVAQLGLRDPGIYVASFNRPNLHYTVEPKARPKERLVRFLRERLGQAGIVYCGTRRGTEALAEKLRGEGFKAVPYHAGMELRDRARNQEAFLHDRVNIICATIAFGMGVNKPNIRFVVHYDLPKNIESYYQETGRAGRDGDPADCLLLFGRNDLINHERRIDEKSTRHEQEIARQQLEAMTAFAESKSCRRRELLAYFGETFGTARCEACDNCTGRSGVGAQTSGGKAPTDPGPTEDRTQDARRFLACLDEIIRTSFSVGVGWVAEVLTGSTSDRLMRHRHDQLKAFGRGRSVSKTVWSEIGRELLRRGFLERSADKHQVLQITAAGRDFALGRTEATVEIRKARNAAPDRYDETLFGRLRQLRRRIADERSAPAFVVFSDLALQQMAREYPVSPEFFIRISGVGAKKLEELGELFMKEIADHVESNGRQGFAAVPGGPTLA
jgi:ATP-dependent DNA helicase RecQ